MASAPSTPAPVKSALRTLDVIELVVAHAGGVVAQDVAQALGIPVSSLSYLLSTLVERQYLMREGRRYLPGPGLERLRVSPSALPLADRMAPLVRALKSELNETASFLVRVGWEVTARTAGMVRTPPRLGLLSVTRRSVPPRMPFSP